MNFIAFDDPIFSMGDNFSPSRFIEAIGNSFNMTTKKKNGKINVCEPKCHHISWLI